MQRRTPAVSQGHVEDFALLLQSRMTLPSLSNLALTLPNVNVRLLSLQPPRPIPHTLAGFCTEQTQELFRRGITASHQETQTNSFADESHEVLTMF